MNSSTDVIAGAGLSERAKKSRWPAKLDFLQSASGLLLALFMWAHMCFVASILISKDAFWAVAKFFEGYFFFGESHTWLVSVVVGAVFALFIGHAGLAMRKFPSNYRQYKSFLAHKNMLHHEDTSLWFVQVYTGFAMFFLGSVHLYYMFSNPGLIGPYESADRIWTQSFWPLYILLLLAVEFHGGIGLYRLTVKWGWFEGGSPDRSRANLKKLKWGLTAFFLVLGFMSLAAYIKIGIEHADHAGERYVPTHLHKSLSVNSLALRCRPKAMDARREPPLNVIHWARLATPQTRFGAATLRAGVDLSASLCRREACDPLPRSGRLREQASRALPAGGRLCRERVRARLAVNDTAARLASRAASQIGPGAGSNYLRTSS